MKKILLKYSQNRKAPNKAVDKLRTQLAAFCHLFNCASYEVHSAPVEDQKAYVINIVSDAIELMERTSQLKKGALRICLSRPDEGLKDSYIWLIWGTDNGGVNLVTIVMKNTDQVTNLSEGGEV